jgi:hypothetical protein
MLNRSAHMLAAGAAIFALVASAASGQDTTRTRRTTSTRRIPVAKENPGEVTVRVDSVTVYKTDTLTVTLPPRTDTVVKTNTVVRVDTVTQMVPIKVPNYGGFYIGAAVGSSMPAAAFNNSDHPGWRFEVPLGYDWANTPFGIRLNGGYADFSPHTWVEPFLNNANMWNIDGDIKLRVATASAHMTRFGLYALGGVSYNWFKNILEDDDGILSVGNITNGVHVPLNPDTDWHSGWGWNTGAGVEAGHGHANIFAEVRFNRFNGVFTNISSVPLVIGVNWSQF